MQGGSGRSGSFVLRLLVCLVPPRDFLAGDTMYTGAQRGRAWPHILNSVGKLACEWPGVCCGAEDEEAGS